MTAAFYKDFPQHTKSWAFQEAKSLVERYQGQKPEKGYILFETGYGPSGLPHIGTFGEVARTSMVRYAFAQMSDIPTKLFAISDDLDGLRKVPDNIPNQEMVRKHLGKALTNIPDPYGTHSSYGDHMNQRLCAFLDRFGFEYEFRSATHCYQEGLFDQSMVAVLEHYDAIMAVMLPTLGEERQASYSPFLPICPETGIVLQVPVIDKDLVRHTILYKRDDGQEIETSVKGGACKLQWKADWGMRWRAFEVDYEMHGKDLIPSADLSSKICRITGGKPPILFRYELFLDEKGQKISKSKGNGLTIDEWLSYAPKESLSLYMFQSPTKAKRLFFDIIPKTVDEYLTFWQKFHHEDPVKQYDNPLWHIHASRVPAYEEHDLNFSLLLNLASAANAENSDILWGFISAYDQNALPSKMPFLNELVAYAVRYYHDFVKPNKHYRIVNEEEKLIFLHIIEMLKSNDFSSPTEMQNKLYDLARHHQYDDLKLFFQLIYEVLLGQSQGPRLGSLFAILGQSSSIQLVNEALVRSSLKEIL
jgi:lysyl-tRNA synthetase class 1